MLIYCLSIQLEEKPTRTKIFILAVIVPPTSQMVTCQDTYPIVAMLIECLSSLMFCLQCPFQPIFFSRSLDSSSTGQLSSIAWFIQSLHLTDFLISTYQNPTHSTDCGTSGSTISRDSHGVSKPILMASASCQGVRSTSHLPLEPQRKAQLCFSGRRGGTWNEKICVNRRPCSLPCLWP